MKNTSMSLKMMFQKKTPRLFITCSHILHVRMYMHVHVRTCITDLEQVPDRHSGMREPASNRHGHKNN